MLFKNVQNTDQFLSGFVQAPNELNHCGMMNGITKKPTDKGIMESLKLYFRVKGYISKNHLQRIHLTVIINTYFTLKCKIRFNF